MKTGIVIQARIGSTRLPGKVLLRVGDRTLLELCARRAARSRSSHVVVIATTTLPADDAVAAEADRLGLPCVRGSESDVLSRYHLAARTHALDRVCRITSDCPFIDPDIIDEAIHLHRTSACDYVSNTVRRSYPRGLDVEVFHGGALETADRDATEAADREHVTRYFYTHAERFSLDHLVRAPDLSHLRWTVDEPDDLRLVRELALRVSPSPEECTLRDLLLVMERHPELGELNAAVRQRES